MWSDERKKSSTNLCLMSPSKFIVIMEDIIGKKIISKWVLGVLLPTVVVMRSILPTELGMLYVIKYIERKYGALIRTIVEVGSHLALKEFHRNQHLRLLVCAEFTFSPLILRVESFLQAVGMSDGLWRRWVAQTKCYLAVGYTRAKSTRYYLA